MHVSRTLQRGHCGFATALWLSKCIFDDCHGSVQLVDGAFVLDAVNDGAPIAVLNARRFVPFALQIRWKFVTSFHLHIISRKKINYLLKFMNFDWIVATKYAVMGHYRDIERNVVSLTFLGGFDLVRMKFGCTHRSVAFIAFVRYIHHLQVVRHERYHPRFNKLIIIT